MATGAGTVADAARCEPSPPGDLHELSMATSESTTTMSPTATIVGRANLPWLSRFSD